MNILLMLQLAFAEDIQVTSATIQQSLTDAHAAILAKDYVTAKNLLDQVYEEAPDSTELLKADTLAQIWYLRGVSAHLQGIDPLDHYRQALILAPEKGWDETLSTDEGAQDAFWAIKSEIMSRQIVSLYVPEQYGQAKLYVDGFERKPADFAYQGMHLAQVQCPEGEIFGKWTNFERGHKWLKMCPYKFDVTDMPVEEETDEWAMFGGSESAAPEVNMSNQVVAPPLFQRLHKPTLYGAGGAAVVSLGLYSMALSNNKKFEDLANSNVVSVDDLESLRSTTNTIAISSATLGVLSGGLYFYSLSQAKLPD